MIVEWLKIKVAPAYRETFIQKDDELWTPFLQGFSGFVHKEVWIHPDELSEVVIVIHWATLEQQQAVPKAALVEMDKKLVEALHPIPHQVLEVKLYQLRKSIVS